jgi:hypothetical protein
MFGLILTIDDSGILRTTVYTVTYPLNSVTERSPDEIIPMVLINVTFLLSIITGISNRR